MKKLLASTVLAVGLVGFAGVAQAESHGECGRVTVANMNWASAEVLANIDKSSWTEGYGCDVELVTGDTMPTLTSMMEKGEPDVAPELPGSTPCASRSTRRSRKARCLCSGDRCRGRR
jgi:glycine betaine/proline transport system substrate-binding protein